MKSTGSVLAILLALTACTSKPPVTHDPFGLKKASGEFDLESTVIILDPITMDPHCSGFSITFNGEPALVTAAHCVSRPQNDFDLSPYAKRSARIGDSVFFITRSEWNGISNSQSEARVTFFDAAHDRAVILPIEANDTPAPIPVANLCNACDLEHYGIQYISALYGWDRHYGNITGQVVDNGTKFWSSDTSILLGWSGSPVINSDGQAVGIVSKCEGKDYPTGHQCRPGWSLFTDVR